jgi:hypothetical protein
MVGSLTDWEFRETTTQTDRSAYFSLSATYSKTGSKSLKYTGLAGSMAINNLVYINSQSKGRISAYFYLPTIAQTAHNSYIYMGLHCGQQWSGLDWEYGCLSTIQWNPNTPALSYFKLGYYNGDGTFTPVGGASKTLTLTEGKWYRIEHTWKVITNADGNNYLSFIGELYDESDNLVTVLGATLNSTNYKNPDGASVGIFNYLANASNAVYTDDFMAYE